MSAHARPVRLAAPLAPLAARLAAAHARLVRSAVRQVAAPVPQVAVVEYAAAVAVVDGTLRYAFL